ncbi:RNA polymerase, sigma-24 subunit, ECF subfamily [Fibrella aestuarina BUZ 2]|uniref:RNA polymerase, sigma-24 subunit, ECF subfamily n=1 Tax=Fibrella aestuarina BUZ 2 TaxID=1166018 RepID=I0K913_9BACT|nr:RNA polymerase sigma factor [Fibrella aestuarina]CCH00616.1 RNA polymerase, sigma-24 subunit, ECF subfamily [Fibrella aestuarina BUZ 2]
MPATPNTTELFRLLTAIGQGDEAAFRQFYDQTKGRVFNTALGYVPNREDAEEITQDVFVAVFRSAGTFRGEASPTTWLYRLTVSKALDWVKHRRRQKRVALLTSLFGTDTGDLPYEPPDPVHPGVLLDQQENAAALFRAIDKLADKQKTAYILARVEGLSNVETADVMQVSVGAVESLLARATENLKKQLTSFYKSFREP